MPQFEIEEKEVTVHTVTSQNVNHGKELKNFFSITLKFTGHPSFLKYYDPKLIPFLFDHADESNGDLIDLSSDDQTKLRFPNLDKDKEHSVEYEGDGYDMEIDQGITGYRNIALHECKVNTLKFKPLDGGLVEYSFRVQGYPVDETQCGKLNFLHKRKVTITLTPPGRQQSDQADVEEALEEALDGIEDASNDVDYYGLAKDLIDNLKDETNEVSHGWLKAQLRISSDAVDDIIYELKTNDIIGDTDDEGIFEILEEAEEEEAEDFPEAS